MTDAEVKYFETENRRIWRLMGWSIGWVVFGVACLFTGAILMQTQYPRWLDYVAIAFAACAHIRAIVLLVEIQRRNWALRERIEAAIKTEI